jgi:hypothetical protein
MIQSSKLENTIFFKLGLYYSNYYINTVDDTIVNTIDVL